MKDNRERVLDIQEAIGRIEKYSVKGRKSFEKDEWIQNWMVRHLQIIGEASSALTEDFRNRHSEIDWRKIRGMRNVLVHDYTGIDLDIVWQVIEQDLPKLKQDIHRILE